MLFKQAQWAHEFSVVDFSAKYMSIHRRCIIVGQGALVAGLLNG
jgi:hypothetical protein